VIETVRLCFARLQKTRPARPKNSKPGSYVPLTSYPHGAPLGGFGAGTIGRSPYGDFNIWHLKVGAHVDEPLKACCFHVHQRSGIEIFTNLLVARPYDDGSLGHFAKPYSPKQGYYSAAFPKAKHVFRAPAHPCSIETIQYSPILPHNYKESSYPVAVFEHHVTNESKRPAEVSIMLTWANMTGWKFSEVRPEMQDNWFSFVKDNANHRHTQVEGMVGDERYVGVVLGQAQGTATEEMDGQLVIAAMANAEAELYCQEYFYVRGSGAELYDTFREHGTLANRPLCRVLEYQDYGAAVAAKLRLQPGETRTISFVVSWDLPIVHFGPGIDRYKYYTRYFDKSGTNALAIAREALTNHRAWSLQIDQWHREIVESVKLRHQGQNKRLLSHYTDLLLNELYFLTDGGCYWDADANHFGLLECFDYPFYETLDVRFYGSFPLLKFWPTIELNVMRDFAREIARADDRMTRFHLYGRDPNLELPRDERELWKYYNVRKLSGACPHDMGSPREEPFVQTAAYTWRNANYWKDLNTKFVLLVFRDYITTKDRKFLEDCWAPLVEAMRYLFTMDRDNDGVPENEDYPDQTYDNWPMTGVSAYCGSLWLAALKAMQVMSNSLGHIERASFYGTASERARGTIQAALWNGRYFDFCQGDNTVMIEQLAGQWYMDLLRQPEILPREAIISSLKTIYDLNYLRVKRGRYGVVSGKTPDNRFTTSEQSRDVWVGSNYAFCSLLALNGLERQAFLVIESLYQVIRNHGFWFRTPEGWNLEGRYTASMYMRPNAIWSLEFQRDHTSQTPAKSSRVSRPCSAG
jgi:non-lysosomal glucosylceramidase